MKNIKLIIVLILQQMNIPEGISKITSKKYAISDMPAKPIASITARTLPPKLKEDLR